jgi:hypothetical protein
MTPGHRVHNISIRRTHYGGSGMSIHSTGLGDDEAGTLAEDTLRGVPAIAEHIGESMRRTYYLLERGYIPAGKLGSIWIASRRALREHYARLTGAAA